jgi:hypothetical protein
LREEAIEGWRPLIEGGREAIHWERPFVEGGGHLLREEAICWGRRPFVEGGDHLLREGGDWSLRNGAIQHGAMFVGAQKKLPKNERGRKEKRRELYNFWPY